jgi:hypothetical protein
LDFEARREILTPFFFHLMPFFFISSSSAKPQRQKGERPTATIPPIDETPRARRIGSHRRLVYDDPRSALIRSESK